MQIGEENFPFPSPPVCEVVRRCGKDEEPKGNKGEENFVKFSSVSGECDAKKEIPVDEVTLANYAGKDGHVSPVLSSAGSPSLPLTRRSEMNCDIENSLWEMLENGNPDLVPLNDIPAMVHFHSAARSRFCAQGKIPAIKVGGVWLTTSRIVMDALRNRHDREQAFKKHQSKERTRRVRSRINS